MAKDTPASYNSLVIYEVYVRNHGPHGTFADVSADLDRIKALGVDVVWLMPIHPIGVKAHKGGLGSPYSIADYRGINSAYGSWEDFANLIQHIHALDMKIMMDVVFNHTAHDSNLVKDHPDWYHQDAYGTPITTVPDWPDVIDLKYPIPELEDYLIESLEGWLKMGVDGFRCDVASIVPAEFWARAHERCKQVNPNTLWLAESTHADFIGSRRRVGLRAISDSELYNACFDLTYDYDIWPIWQAVVRGKEPVGRYLEMLRYQYAILPVNFIKMRCVENHDQARVMKLAPTKNQALAWTAFAAFNKGPFLIYGGEESGTDHTPDHFDLDTIDWNGYPLSPFLTKLSHLKKDAAIAHGTFIASASEPAIVAERETEGSCLMGIFNVAHSAGKINVPIPDGEYDDILSGDRVVIEYGQAPIPATAVILRYTTPVNPRWFYSSMMDFNIPYS